MNEVSIVNLEGNGIDGFNPVSYHDNAAASMIGSPVESGATSFDNKVIQPRKITITGYVTASAMSNVLGELRRMLKDKSFNFYSVVTKDAVINNLAVTDVRNNGSNERLDIAEVEVDFQEVLMDEDLGFSSQGTGDSGTVAGGLKQ